MISSAPRLVTLCTIQPSVTWNRTEQTFGQIAALVAQACETASVDIVVLPEHFNAAVDEDGDNQRWQEAQQFAAELARHHQINLVAGSVERWDAAGAARVNTSVVLDRHGQEVDRYDKRQLFGYEIKRNVRPGHRPVWVELDTVRCGVLICADLWYPELVREFAGTADVLCVPAQTTIRRESQPAYARLLWHNLAMTRAQENVLAVVVGDQAASSEAPYLCGGVASITDPSAEPDLTAIQRTLPNGEAGYVLAAVDLDRLDRFRNYRQENGLFPY